MTPPASAEVDLPAWLSEAIVPVSDLHTAANEVFRTARNGGGTPLTEACKKIGAPNAALQKLMPAPNPELTAEVQQAIDGFDTLAENCPIVAKKPSDENIKAFLGDMKSTEQHLSSADAVILSLYPKE
jgi:spermidine/putrescine-binding protein